jgi:hypothetical protein
LFFELGLAFWNDLVPQPKMTLLRGHIIDTGVQVLGIIPLKISFKVPHRILQVKESPGISWSSLCGTERWLHKRIIVGGSRPGKELRHSVKLKDRLYRSRFHLPASVIDNLWSLLFGTIQDVLSEQTPFEELLGILCPLVPTDQPVDRLAGILIKEQVQIEKQGSLVGVQVAYIPAPPLVGTRDLLSRGRHWAPVMMMVGSSHAHQAFGTQDAIHGRKRDKE